MEKWYKISESELCELIHDSMLLCALQSGGVDNWSGYSDSIHDFLADNAKNDENIYDLAKEELQNYEEVGD